MQQAIAYFITPHGFGHATRAAAVMQALQKARPDLMIHIFTEGRQAIFEQSLLGPFCMHPLNCDVGLVQPSSRQVDYQATLAQLKCFYPLNEDLVTQWAGHVRRLGCRAVICDIAPAGIAVAEAAGIPSFLIENFRWDWIYSDYVDYRAEFRPFIEILAHLFDRADFLIQAHPICLPLSKGLKVPPIWREPRQRAQQVRDALGVDARPLVLVTMGGIPDHPKEVSFLQKSNHYNFLLQIPPEQQGENIFSLSALSHIYFPDLVQAADAVICKLGYSTVAEAYGGATRLGFIGRTNFAESSYLAQFAMNEMTACCIAEEAYDEGSWLDILHQLLQLKPPPKPSLNGADQAARFILNTLDQRAK